MGLLSECLELGRFLFKTPKSSKAIVVYAEYEGSFPVFEGIIAELVETYRQPIAYITSDPTDSITETYRRAFLTPEDVIAIMAIRHNIVTDLCLQ